MNVAYIVPSLQKPSGWRTHAVAFICAMSAHVQPVLFVAQADRDEAKALFPDFPLFVLPFTQQASLHTLKGMSALFSGWQTIATGDYPSIDLVHSLEAYPTGLLGSWLAEKLRCPHALTSHGTYGVIWHRYLLDRLVYQGVLSQTQLVFPVSHGTEQAMRRYFDRSMKNCRVLPISNGNDFYTKVPQQEALEREIPPVPTLLTVGDVKPRKGQHISLQAFAQVKREIPQACYIIVGSYTQNGYFQQLARMIAEQHIDDVIFTGVVSDETLHRHYQEASVFTLTPQEIEGDQFEGFGLVYLEAGAYGLPVVGTRCGGVADAVREGITGFLADPDDIDGIAQAMLRLFKDPALAQEMGRANRLWAETLTWEKNAAEHFRAYQEVVKQ